MSGLSGKVAIVTGGARGIGLAIVEELARAGCRIAVVDVAEDVAEQGAQAARDAGSEGKAYGANVVDADRALAVVADVIDTWGAVDILINNAGITRDGLLMRMSQKDIDDVIDVNLKGAFYYCRAVTKPMAKARSGCIVNMSSIIGIKGNAGQSNYAAAKAGLLAMTRSLAAELGGRGIRVNAVAPGFIQTDMTSGLPQEVKDASLERIPLRRFGEAGDIAGAVGFLVSAAGSYITGVTLVVDGGMSL